MNASINAVRTIWIDSMIWELIEAERCGLSPASSAAAGGDASAEFVAVSGLVTIS